MTTASLTPGKDRLSGAVGDNNYFFFAPADLSADDMITGTPAELRSDFLIATAGGTIAASQFDGVEGIDVLELAAAGNAVALDNDLAAGSSLGIFVVEGAEGDDTVDASGVTNHSRVAFYAGAGTDRFIGGNGNDYAEFTIADLTTADSFSGGPGFDYLGLRMAGSVSTEALSDFTGIEQLILRGPGIAVTLTNAFVAGAGNGVMSVESLGANRVDAGGITNGVRVAFYARSGDHVFVGGNGSDYLAFEPRDFNSGDHISGGADNDIIEIYGSGSRSSIGPTAFNNVTGIDVLILNGADVTLPDQLVAEADNGVLVVVGHHGNAIDASAVNHHRVILMASADTDLFTGGGGSDLVQFNAADLTAADTFAGGAGFDILQLTTAGAVDAAAFTNFSGVDELYLTLGGNIVTLGGGLVASSDNQVFVVHDEAGGNVVDASAATLGGRVVFNAVAGDRNTYTGGTGSDFFQFGDANLNDSDTLTGGNGAGTDFLQVTTAASVTAADLANVTQIEVVELLAGGSIELADTLSNTGRLEAGGTGAADAIDGSAVTSYDIVFKGNGGADALTGGAGNDQFFLPDTNFVAIGGNDGFDKIVLTPAFDGQTFDLSAQVSKITAVEAITLEQAAGALIVLGPGDIAQINSSGNFLYVAGGSDDEISITGSGWTILETDHTNPNLPGHTFVHVHNGNGSDLYVDSLFAMTIV